MNDPVITIIIPTRNDMATLPAALASVDAQNIDGMEIIVVDDGSSDGTAEYLRSRCAQDPRTRVVTLGGAGPSAARNAAISETCAPLTAFLDADDQWRPGKLARQIEAMAKHPDLTFCFTDYLHMTPGGDDLGTCFDYWRPSLASRLPVQFEVLEHAEASLLGCNLVGTSTVVAQTQALRNANGFATSMRSAEDWDLWLRLAAAGPVAYSTMVTATYLVRPGSVTSMRLDRIQAMESIADRYRGRTGAKYKAALRRADSRIALARAEAMREHGRHWQACTSALRAFGYSPRLGLLRSAGGDLLRGCGAMLRTAA